MFRCKQYQFNQQISCHNMDDNIRSGSSLEQNATIESFDESARISQSPSEQPFHQEISQINEQKDEKNVSMSRILSTLTNSKLKILFVLIIVNLLVITAIWPDCLSENDGKLMNKIQPPKQEKFQSQTQKQKQQDLNYPSAQKQSFLQNKQPQEKSQNKNEQTQKKNLDESEKPLKQSPKQAKKPQIQPVKHNQNSKKELKQSRQQQKQLLERSQKVKDKKKVKNIDGNKKSSSQNKPLSDSQKSLNKSVLELKDPKLDEKEKSVHQPSSNLNNATLKTLPAQKKQLSKSVSSEQAIKNSSEVFSLSERSKYSFDNCHNEQIIFHQFKPEERIMYYRSYYGLYFKSCGKKRGRADVQAWSQEREIIEWAKINLKIGEKVLYDCRTCSNLQDILSLSLFLGPTGQLTLFYRSQINTCLSGLISLYKLQNIKFIDRVYGAYQKYSVVISKNEAYLKNQIVAKELWKNPPKQFFVQLSDPVVKLKLSQKIKNLNSVKAFKVILTQMNCEDKLQFQSVNLPKDSGKGYYYIHKEDYLFSEGAGIEVKRYEDPWLISLQKQYQLYKKKLPKPQERKDKDKIIQQLPFQLNRLSNMSQQEKHAWPNQKQLVLWIKNITKPTSIVYYEYKPLQVNIFIIFNIAFLLSKGKLLLCCSLSSENRIKQQMKKLSIQNIVFIRKTSKEDFESSEAIITDNIQIINKFEERQLSDSQRLLGFFNENNSKSMQLLYRLYVKYHIRKLAIIPSFYYGYDIFDHFYWHSEHPNGFFQIKKKKHVLFAIWNQALKDLTTNRKDSINQLIKVNTAQVKIMNPNVTSYFYRPEMPIHKAFPYLSLVHKSDFLRIYLMYNYGGAYTDVKHFHYDIEPYIQKLEDSPDDIYAYGYPEIKQSDIGCREIRGQPSCQTIRSKYNQLMGTDNYIHKKKNPLVSAWIKRVYEILDEKYEDLKKHPAIAIWQFKGMQLFVNGTNVKSQYPLDYLMLNTEVFCRIQFANLGHYYLDLPYPIMVDYR